jgi:hypothetical protein
MRYRLERRARDTDRLYLHVPDGMLESILRIPRTSLVMGVDEAQGEQRPQIQSEAGLRVLDYCTN